MIIEKILGKLPDNQTKPLETVSFQWFEAEQKILKKMTSNHEEIGLRLNEPLFDGAMLYEDENRVIALSLLPCQVVRVNVSTMGEMGRVCFELGNRHLPLSIGEDCVVTPYDNPTFEYLRRLGFHCEQAVEKFTPEVVVRGHHHG
jgi:urease accessory protein